jgi:hypothetical protein
VVEISEILTIGFDEELEGNASPIDSAILFILAHDRG